MKKERKEGRGKREEGIGVIALVKGEDKSVEHT